MKKQRIYWIGVMVAVMAVIVVPVRADTLGTWLFDEGSGEPLWDEVSQTYNAYLGDSSATSTYDPTRSTSHPSGTGYDYAGNKSLQFTGALGNTLTSEATVGYDSAYRLTKDNSYTMEMWVYVASSTISAMTTQQMSVVDNNVVAGGSGSYIVIGKSGGNSYLRTYFFGYTLTAADANVSDLGDSWFHVAASYNADYDETHGRLGLYINGVLTQQTFYAKSSLTDQSGTSDLILGATGHATAKKQFLGFIDEFTINDVAITADFTPAPLGPSNVPEPCTMVLLGVGAMGLISPRARSFTSYD